MFSCLEEEEKDKRFKRREGKGAFRGEECDSILASANHIG